MKIWVDADACPNVIKEILFRAAERVQVPLILVANTFLRVPPSAYIKFIRVEAGAHAFPATGSSPAWRDHAARLPLTSRIALVISSND